MFLPVFSGDLYKAYTDPPMPVGQLVLDDDGDVWQWVRASEDLLFGEVVRSSVELVTGTVTTAVAIGSQRLIDTGAFTSLTQSQLRGARGQTLGTLANGGGQGFEVLRRVNDDELRIALKWYTSAAGVGHWASNSSDRPGFAIALTTSSTFSIFIFGYVQDAEQGLPVNGICLVDGGVDASVAPFFAIKKTGMAPVLVDDSDSNILPGQWVTVSTSTQGYVEGPNVTGAPAIAELASLVGVALAGEVGFDCLLEVELSPALWGGQGAQLPGRTHPLNDVTV